jgi:hypothetical protein
MENSQLVFTGDSAAARALAEILESHGVPISMRTELSPEHAWGIGPLASSVLVAREDAARANQLADEWRAAHPMHVQRLNARLRRLVLMSLVPGMVGYLADRAVPSALPSPELHRLIVLWLASIFILVHLESRRHRAGGDESPAA